MELPIQSALIQQFMVQFACRIPTKAEILPAERNSLKEILQNYGELDLFQLFNEGVSETSPHLFQSAKQYFVGNMTITVPSFILSHNSITVVHPIKIAAKTFITNDSFDTGYLNGIMRDLFLQIQKTLPKVHFNRAGKIFELSVGPLSDANKSALLGNLFRYQLNHVLEVNLQFTPVRDVGGEQHNLQTRLSCHQPAPGSSYVATVRVDVNNRELKESLEPTQLQQFWNQADGLIGGYLQEILGAVEHA